MSGYDNYGYALAGYLVQKAARISFSRYVEERLFGPLKMNRSSFSPGVALRKHLATGYRLEGDLRHSCQPGYVNITPAAGLCTTAIDMSRFLVALLTKRCPDGSRAFPASVISGLEKQQFAFNPSVPGRCFGFDVVTVVGRRVLRQTGQWPGFNSLLLLVPREHCGICLAYNLCDNLHMRSDISRLFLSAFIPATPIPASSITNTSPSPRVLETLCGSYLSVRFPQASPRLGAPLEAEVTRSPEGQLEIGGRRYREIGPLVFERVRGHASGVQSGGQRVAFRVGPDGKIADLITETGAFRRVGWSETPEGHLWLMRAASLIFLSVVVLWPVVFLVRRVFAAAPAVKPPFRRECSTAGSKAASMTAFGACALALWVEISLAIVGLDLPPFAEFYGLPASVRHLLAVMPVLMVLAAALVAFSVLAWRRRFWSFVRRVHFTLVPVAFALFFYVFYLRHLLFVA